MNNFLQENERLDDLQVKINGRGLYVIQNPSWFCYGIDAVLLANFAKIKKDDVVADLGTGSGVIPLLIAAKTNAKSVTGYEIQQDVSSMTKRSIKLNDLEDKINIICEDIKNIKKPDFYDVITCNPPYKEKNGGLVNPNIKIAIARHEIYCDIFDVIKAAKSMLKFGGRLNVIHRPERLVDIIWFMRECKIEPKRIRYVHPYAGKSPTMVLIEGRKGCRAKIITEPPLYVHEKSGSYTEEINRIYNN